MNFLGVINPVALQLGPFQIRWYGIIIASAVILAVYLSVLEGRKQNILDDDIYDLLLYSLPVAIICARIYYVVFEWSYYSHHLSETYRIWDGGIAIYGALIGAVIVILIFCRRRNIPTWTLLDVIAATVILAQGIGRWGNFMNQEAHGVATTLGFLKSLHLPKFIINQMYIDGTYYQPTFLYESLWDISGFVVLIILRRQKKLLKSGEVVLSYIIWYSFGRFFIEGMRTDSLMLGSLRVSQWLSLILFISAIAAIFYRRYNDPLLKWYTE